MAVSVDLGNKSCQAEVASAGKTDDFTARKQALWTHKGQFGSLFLLDKTQPDYWRRTIESELRFWLFTRTKKIPNLESFSMLNTTAENHMRSTELCIKPRQSETQQQIPFRMAK